MVWTALEGGRICSLAGFPGLARAALASDDGRFLAVSAETGVLGVWDLASGANMTFLASFTGRLHSFALTSTLEFIVASCDDDKLRIWSADMGAVSYCLKGFGGRISCAINAPDGRYVAVTLADQSVHLCRNPELGNVKCILKNCPTNCIITSICGSHNTEFCATGFSNGSSIVWNAVTGELISAGQHAGEDESVIAVRFSTNDRYFATLGKTGTAKIWLIEGFSLISSMRCSDPEDLQSVVQAVADLRDERNRALHDHQVKLKETCADYEQKIFHIHEAHSQRLVAIQEEHQKDSANRDAELDLEKESHTRGIEELKNVIRHKEMEIEALHQDMADLHLLYDQARGINVAGLSSRKIVDLQQQCNNAMRALREAFVLAIQDETHTVLEEPEESLADREQARQKQMLEQLSNSLTSPLSPLSRLSVSAGKRSSPSPRQIRRIVDSQLNMENSDPSFPPAPLDVSHSTNQ
jgi:hypothetical protein